MKSSKTLTSHSRKNKGFYTYIPRFPGMGSLEFKYFDTYQFNATIAGGSATYGVNLIAVGTAVNQRVGNAVHIQCVDVDCFACPNVDAAIETFLFSVVADRIPCGSIPAYATIYDTSCSAAIALPRTTASSTSMLGRFSEVGSYASDLVSNSGGDGAISTTPIRWRCRLPVASDVASARYDPAVNALTPVSGLLVLTVGNHSAANMAFSYHTRVWYTDD